MPFFCILLSGPVYVNMFELDMALILFSHFADHLISFGAFHTARSFVPFFWFSRSRNYLMYTKKKNAMAINKGKFETKRETKEVW